MSDGPDDDDAPDAAGVVEDVGGGDFVEEGDAGGDAGCLEGKGATGGGGPFGVGAWQMGEGGFEERDEGEGEDGDGGEHGGGEVTETPFVDPNLLDDIGTGVSDGREESEEEARDDAAAVGFAFSAEENHGQCGEASGGEHPRREVFSGKQKREERDEEHFGSEDGGGERDVAAAEGDEGEDLSDKESGAG